MKKTILSTLFLCVLLIPASAGAAIKGYNDTGSLNAEGIVRGWACDQANYARKVTINVYDETGQLLQTQRASKYRPLGNDGTGTPYCSTEPYHDYHGFDTNVAYHLTPGPHQITVKAVMADGTEYTLPGSPVTVQGAPATAACDAINTLSDIDYGSGYAVSYGPDEETNVPRSPTNLLNAWHYSPTQHDSDKCEYYCAAGSYFDYEFGTCFALPDGSENTNVCNGTTCSSTSGSANTGSTDTPVTPVAPTLNATCSTDGTQLTLSWDKVPGASVYPLRINDATNGWSGTCDSLYDGDMCKNVNGTSHTTQVVPGREYHAWVHAAATPTTGWSDPSKAVHIVCSAPTGSGGTTITATNADTTTGNTTTAKANKHVPVGSHEDVNSTTCVTTGWACDLDSATTPLNISFYDGSADSSGSTLLGTVMASRYRNTSVASQCGANAWHGFSYSLPESVRDGQTHSIYAYATDLNDKANGLKLLGSSPLSVTCAATKQKPTGSSNNSSSTGSTIGTQNTTIIGPTNSGPAISSAQTQAIVALLNSFGVDASVISRVQAILSGNVVAEKGETFTFNRDMYLGATGEDVIRLQQYLNNHGFTVASSGPGSPGNETDFFGPATVAAVIRYQLAKSIVPPAGYFGQSTRAAVNADQGA